MGWISKYLGSKDFSFWVHTMLKQIISKLSRKSLTPRGESSRSTVSPLASGKGNRTLSGSGGSSSRANAAKRASSSAVFPASMVAGIEPLVPFKDVPNSEKMNLFVSKLSLCCVTCDFTDPGKDIVEKDVKEEP